MGLYTQFEAKIPLRKDTPDEVVLLIAHAIYDPDFHSVTIDFKNGIESQFPLTLPDHAFFKTERWEGLFMQHRSGGAKLIKSKSGYYDLEINCDINYGHTEVQEFVSWITPYVAGRKKKQYIGRWINDNMSRWVNEYIERITE